jgi:hypothetical protein
VNKTNQSLNPDFPYTLRIYDAYDDTLLESGIQISTKNYQIPLNYTKKIGTYRFALQDSRGRYGETTLTVRS